MTRIRLDVVMLVLIALTQVLNAESSTVGCNDYYRLGFLPPDDANGIRRGMTQENLIFGCIVPRWLADSLERFIPSWVAKSDSLGHPVALPNYRFDPRSLWVSRVFSFDSSRKTVVLELRESSSLLRPIFVVANYARSEYYPLVGPGPGALIEQFNQVLGEFRESMPESPSCLAMVFLSILLGDSKLAVVTSGNDVINSIRLNYFSLRSNLGPVNADDLYLSDVSDLAVHSELRREFEKYPRRLKDVKKVLSGLEMGEPRLRIGKFCDTLEMWVHVFDTGEVSKWSFVLGKDSRLLDVNYLSQPVFVESVLGPSRRIYDLVSH